MPEWYIKFIAGIFFAIVFSGCVSVKPYQRAYLNDPEMQLDTKAAAQFEVYYESIREGSSAATGGKTPDGCGCK